MRGPAAVKALAEHGIYLPDQEQPEWREQGTAQQLETLAAEFAAVADAKDN